MSYTVTFTYILGPDSKDMHTSTKEFPTKQAAWNFVKALDRHSRAKLSEWSDKDIVDAPCVPCSQPLKSVYVFQDDKQVFGWGCPDFNDCYQAFYGRRKLKGFVVSR